MKTKIIPGYSDYEVSTTGKVFSLKGGSRKELKPCVGSNGYKNVGLSMGGVTETKSIHRLVALTHVKNPNPKKFNIVNHLDGNKLNNAASNLEWTDHKSNAIHGASIPKNVKARKNRSAQVDVVSVLKSIHGKVSAETFSVVFKDLTNGR